MVRYLDVCATKVIIIIMMTMELIAIEFLFRVFKMDYDLTYCHLR